MTAPWLEFVPELLGFDLGLSAVRADRTSSESVGLVVPMPTLPFLTTSVETPTEKASPLTVTVDSVVSCPLMKSPVLATLVLSEAEIPVKAEPSPMKNGAVTPPALTLMPEEASTLYCAAPVAVKVPLDERMPPEERILPEMSSFSGRAVPMPTLPVLDI